MNQENIRVGSGKATIDDMRKTTHSTRAMDDKLRVEKGFCTLCKHDKIFVGNTAGGQGIIKCARCKHYLA